MTAVDDRHRYMGDNAERRVGALLQTIPGHTGLLRGWVRVVRPCAAATKVTTVVMVLLLRFVISGTRLFVCNYCWIN